LNDSSSNRIVFNYGFSADKDCTIYIIRVFAKMYLPSLNKIGLIGKESEGEKER
jgi:hypothetical protein